MAKFFIFRPVLSMVLAMILTLVGVIAGLDLPIAQYPQITLPTVQVTANYPGASAEVVQQAIAQPIEEQVNGVSGMLYMNSNSAGNGNYVLNITFSLGTDPDIAAVQVQNRVAQASLPQEVISAGVTTQKTTSNVLMYVALLSPNETYDELFLSNYATLNVVNALKRVKGIGGISLFGANFSMRLWLQPDRMASLGITTNDIQNAVREQNILAPTGQVGQQPAPATQQFQYNIETRGRLSDVKEFEDIVLRAQPDGSFVRMRDVARVELGAGGYFYQSRLNGRPATIFTINLSPDASALETASLVKAELESLASAFPNDMAYDIVLDNTIFVKSSLEEVVRTLFEALGLVLLVVFIFLKDWRATLIPMLAVPISLIGTLAIFTLFGFTINTLTLFAMVLAIGIVVDDAIVVVEAVEHHLESDGVTPKEAALRAMHDVSGPVIATALVLAAVFVPVAFLGGVAGVMYKQFAVTVAVSTTLSAFIALSLTPVLSMLLLESKDKNKPPTGILMRVLAAFDRWFARVTQSYGNVVQSAIKHSVLSLSLLAVVIFVAFNLMSKIPGGFVPSEDQGYFLGSVQLPAASSLNRTKAASTQVDTILKDQDAVTKRLVINGFNILNGAPQSDSALFVAILKPWKERADHSLSTTLGAVYEESGKLPDANILAFNPPPIPGLGTTGGFAFELQDRLGGGPQALANVANDFMAQARKHPEIGSIYTSFNPDNPALQLTLNREKIKELGVSIADVLQTLQAFLGGVNINNFSRFGQTYQVTMQADSVYRGDLESLKLFYVRSSNNQMVPLSDLVKSDAASAPSVLGRFNLYQTAQINGNPAPGYSSGEVIEKLESLAAEFLPQGYGYAWSGISLQEKESAGEAPIVFGLALLFVFLFLAALYESWSIPFAVLLAVPLGIFGAMIGLWYLGLNNNVYTQIGLILLIGLMAKNAILIVEFAKVRYDQGEDVVVATLEAAKLRLRPIVMTSLAFTLGVVPLVLAAGPGSASRFTMGIVVFCGMLLAVPLLVLIVPVLFVVICRLAARVSGSSPTPAASTAGGTVQPPKPDSPSPAAAIGVQPTKEQ